MKATSTLIFLLSVCVTAFGQQLTQTIRGTVVDKVTRTPLPGATIVVVGSDPLIGGTSDDDGNFKLSKVPVGNHVVRISFVGYKERTLPGIVVNSGKEVVLNLPIEEDIVRMEEIVITPGIEKNKPINDMATVSARTFSVEETRKFAAAVNDPGRAALSFAGAVSTGDNGNSISIRGNSPFGLLWRMEGVDIPNPNHFANAGTSGGGISILSSQLMSNSDFMTGAFPAEYGNALAGVFDINLRKGNNEKREYTVQTSFLGTDIALEGPFSAGYRGSYLINYRYSTLSILRTLGFEIGDAVTNFQDLAYNISLPAGKAGTFSVFGFGGLSNELEEAIMDSTQWAGEGGRYGSNYFSNSGATGIRHAINLGSDTYLQSAIVMSGNNHGYSEDRLDDNYTPQFTYEQSYINKKVTVSSVLNHKFNARHSTRSGVYFNEYFYDLRLRDLDRETNIVYEPLNSVSRATTLQAFTQWNYRATDRLTFNTGLHFLYLTNSNSTAVEPRASIKYELNDRQSVSVGYGLHSQMQPIGVYEAKLEQPDGTFIKPNRNLGFNKSHHFVLGYDRSLTKYLRVKAETYYQHLYNIAVEDDPRSPLSTLIVEEGFVTQPLVNTGGGRNYGLELTVEQFTHNNLYFLLSLSLFDSKYKTLENLWHNTRFNTQRAISFTAGKEFPLRKNRTFGVNLRTIYTGGLRTTPIDLERSIAEARPYYFEGRIFDDQLPDYFRTDLRISLKRNRSRSTSTISIDIQNTTNHKNVGGRYFDVRSLKMQEWYQLPLLPVLAYRVEF